MTSSSRPGIAAQRHKPAEVSPFARLCGCERGLWRLAAAPRPIRTSNSPLAEPVRDSYPRWRERERCVGGRLCFLAPFLLRGEGERARENGGLAGAFHGSVLRWCSCTVCGWKEGIGEG